MRPGCSRWPPLPSQSDADQAAEDAQHHRLDQELPEDVARLAPTALRMPISRVRSVTDTSMMFMMPMPPTSSEMPAMAPRKMVSTLVIWSKTPRMSS